MIYFLYFSVYMYFIFILLYINIKDKSKDKMFYDINLRDCSTKILIVIPAHNEDNMLLNTIKAINNSLYPKELIDIVLLADRCTDKTIEIAKNNNVNVYDNLYNPYKTKGGILNSFFTKYCKLVDKYDYICIIDADSLVSIEFFYLADKAFKREYKIVQSSVIVKKENNSLVLSFMVLYQAIINMFIKYYHLLNKSILLLGKGIFISPCILYKISWNGISLIEDVDFSFQALLAGFKIHYFPEMKIKIIQPNCLSDMWHQQRRWLFGQKQLIKNYKKKILNKHIEGVAKAFIAESYIMKILFFIILFSLLNLYLFIFHMILLYLFSIITVIFTIKIDKSMYKLNNMDIFCFSFLLIFWYIIYLSIFLFLLRIG